MAMGSLVLLLGRGLLLLLLLLHGLIHRGLLLQRERATGKA